MAAEFNFFQQWYPLTPVEDLDPEKPTPVTLLGKRLVIWKSKNSANYRVFFDQCPHRLAPLSEGRVDDKTGNLMCSYHGWEFNSEGKCTRIPQAENPEIITKNQDNFCVIVLPSRAENDLLWVWADSNSAEIAAATPLPLSPQIDAKKGFVWSSFVRDLDYDWQTLVENVIDPSHVQFAHHNVQGNRERATPLPIKVINSNMNLIQGEITQGFPTKITFEPPCRLEYAIQFGTAEKQLGLVTYCVPISPGKCRIVAQFPRNFAKNIHHLTPRWWTHIKTRNLVLDGDMILLHQQEYFFQQKQAHETWQSAYKLPTSADRLVIEFRRWFDKYCDGKLPWNEVNVKQINEHREVVLDRYKQHTQHCHSCRGALKNVQLLQKILLGYFAVSVAGVTLLPDEFRLQVGLPVIILALLGLATYSWLKFRLEPKFYFVDYVHSEK
ncbi:MAG: Rieske 2Fe-2S domain-containing protein [Oscillatoria sp. PMC 1068.18]|nr:Rieske 2Fe-2S domain-containing protein [Oscillatoria sp. PMC 1076.18]MEC4988744.1 Rieske 2Fe-2S domain-containing protein [Oscillatoria sp. PMC 1068.18]